MTGHTLTDGPAAARRTLAGLEAKRAAALGRQRELADEREALAYDAATGDAAARKALDVLTRDAATVAIQIANLDSALGEARRRVASADEQARRAELRARAIEAREKLGDLRQQGEIASAALRKFGEAFAGFIAIANDIRRLSPAGPGRELILANVRRVIQVELLPFHLQSEVVPPGARRSLSEVVDSWASVIEARIAATLDEEEEAA